MREGGETRTRERALGEAVGTLNSFVVAATVDAACASGGQTHNINNDKKERKKVRERERERIEKPRRGGGRLAGVEGRPDHLIWERTKAKAMRLRRRALTSRSRQRERSQRP